MICGVDEVGMGAIAGPMIVAAVVLPPNTKIAGVRDSKKISRYEERIELYSSIVDTAEAVAIEETSPEGIDKIGLSEAWRRAVISVILECQHKAPNCLVVIDGIRTVCHPGIKVPIEARVKADANVQEVSAASIVAKALQVMWALAADVSYPRYGFRDHHGYPTKRHKEAIAKYGLTPLHRWSFGNTNKEAR